MDAHDAAASVDPRMAGAMATAHLSGLDFLRKIIAGELEISPMARHTGMQLTEVERGAVSFTCRPGEQHRNSNGTVHGGFVCTLLDTAVGYAARSVLPIGFGQTSIELKVSYLRAVTGDSGLLTCSGHVTKPGRRVNFSEGEVRDEAGRILATASGTLLVFALEGKAG